MGSLTIRCGKNIPRRPVLWMWPGRIPKNKVTLIQGDGGEGKSSFSLFFGAGMSVGKAPPALIDGVFTDCDSTAPINVFYVSTEDESEDTALPRFLRFGGNEERYYDNDEEENHFEMTEECLEEVYEACHPGLIIIDPYQSFLPDGIHLGNLGEMRKVIAMMMRFAARREVTILLIGHLNKNEGSKDIHRGYSGRIYATGFSNGGALSGALAATYPDLLAGISAMGWMIPLGKMGSHSRLPFLLIQGTDEFTRQTASGSMAVMEDEEGALSDLFARNGLFSGEQTPDYDQTSYWGYPADEVLVEYPDYRDIFSQAAHSGDVKWEISRYHHPDYSQPLAELILVEGADHIPHSCNARYAWDFLRRFARAEDGTIIEIDADREE